MAASAAGADVVNNDAEDSEVQSSNADATESANHRPSTAGKQTPAAGDDSGKIPVSSSAGSEETVEQFGSM